MKFFKSVLSDVVLKEKFSYKLIITLTNFASLFPQYFYYYFNFRSSRTEVFCKKGVLRNFAKFTGKQLCQSLFFNKAEACYFIKKEALTQVFPVNFVKFLGKPFL